MTKIAVSTWQVNPENWLPPWLKQLKSDHDQAKSRLNGSSLALACHVSLVGNPGGTISKPRRHLCDYGSPWNHCTWNVMQYHQILSSSALPKFFFHPLQRRASLVKIVIIIIMSPCNHHNPVPPSFVKGLLLLSPAENNSSPLTVATYNCGSTLRTLWGYIVTISSDYWQIYSIFYHSVPPPFV